MIEQALLGFALIGAEWVLILLLVLSVYSIALVIERFRFFARANLEANQFRSEIREAVKNKSWDKALKLAQDRSDKGQKDFDSTLTTALLSHSSSSSFEALQAIAQDSLIRTKITWEKNLSMLATIGNNAPFIGLFGTVLGIIEAFQHLSQKANTGVQTVTSGLAEALIATAVGILVAIPAVAAFNLFQRKVKASLAEAEALKNYLIGQLEK